jgi:hypothetical protein
MIRRNADDHAWFRVSCRTGTSEIITEGGVSKMRRQLAVTIPEALHRDLQRLRRDRRQPIDTLLETIVRQYLRANGYLTKSVSKVELTLEEYEALLEEPGI